MASDHRRSEIYMMCFKELAEHCLAVEDLIHEKNDKIRSLKELNEVKCTRDNDWPEIKQQVLFEYHNKLYEGYFDKPDYLSGLEVFISRQNDMLIVEENREIYWIPKMNLEQMYKEANDARSKN